MNLTHVEPSQEFNQTGFQNGELSPQIMYDALLNKDAAFEGVFFAAIKTTGIFCRPTCTAKKPKPENVVFYPAIHLAIRDGYRPCKVCKPQELPAKMPDSIRNLLSTFEENPAEKIGDRDIRRRGLEPAFVRRWFQKHYGMTFHAYQRLSRLNYAFSKLRAGNSVLDAALDSGYESLSGFNEMFKNLTGVSPKNSAHLNLIYVERIETPLGPMIAGAVTDGVCLLEFFERRMLEKELRYLVKKYNSRIVPGKNPHLELLKKELGEYFAGTRQTFTVKLATPGTEFQQKAWQELQKIPYGSTRSYLEQAAAIEMPGASRAVANANGANRISIVIPCHRIIGSNGELRGYGGGVWRKRRLIDFERNTLLESRSAK